ncbi:hypothetical protein SLEP1_g21309 [Rubroshorea leprosula]|uniref:Uncharacterized protein n=1 Tax=Rubroshorea leprosula TaxID=152421 RepID=A0AAV5JG59_9ROSI|nr:hypothetical protein SLEP1_g21309 [Rubroshorea leprosula]
MDEALLVSFIEGYPIRVVRKKAIISDEVCEGEDLKMMMMV